jgi:hypothetical protein
MVEYSFKVVVQMSVSPSRQRLSTQRWLLIFVIALSVSSTRAGADVINLPDIVVNSLSHRFSTMGTVTTITDEAASMTPAPGTQFAIGTFKAGDVIRQRFVAAPSQQFVVTPDATRESHLYMRSFWEGIVGSTGITEQTGSSISYEGLQGIAPTKDTYFGNISTTTSARPSVEPIASAYTLTGSPFSFTAATDTFTVPTGASGGGTLQLSAAAFSFTTHLDSRFDVIADKSLMTLQSIPEPTFFGAIALTFVAGRAKRRKKQVLRNCPVL